MASKDPDFPNPIAEAQRTAEKLHGAARVEVQVIEGAGHYPHAEMPAQVAPLLINFLEQVGKSARGADYRV